MVALSNTQTRHVTSATSAGGVHQAISVPRQRIAVSTACALESRGRGATAAAAECAGPNVVTGNFKTRGDSTAMAAP